MRPPLRLKTGWTSIPLLAIALLGGRPAADAPPAARGYVTDEAGLLDDASESALIGQLIDLERKAGAQVAVATVLGLEGDIGFIAHDLYEAWGIGDKKTGRGALILVSAGDGRVRIEAGGGLESVLPEGLRDQILEENVAPFFQRNDPAGGVLAAVDAVAAAIAADARVEWTGQPRIAPSFAGRIPWGYHFLFLFLVVVAIAVLGRNARRRGRGKT